MIKVLTYIGKLSRWRRDEVGATAVEFVIVMPILLVTFAVIVEGSRIYWNYQAAVTGVRDAARFVARTTNNDVCDTGGTTFDATAAANTAAAIIRSSLDTDRSTTAFDFPSGVSLAATNPVTTSRSCVPIRAVTGGAVLDTAPVVRVDATVVIQLPLAPLWGFFLTGAENGTVTSTITDQSRIYGL
ncbi:TadE/TadG family type IV pilus assembly protein [Silicimonas sp. MF1-12-2]|uniref:TadE/TadG family type IV pilus assembly protein n=1 Tax=Silicimonas sp. MF1-12-2 TaxID=3384793 RepID=UPI0039B5A763